MSAVPGITGHYLGTLVLDATGQTETIQFDITAQQKSRFSGTFIEGDGSAGVIFGSVNKRGLATFTYQSTNLYNNYKGKARAGLDGQTLAGQFATRQGRHVAAGTFSLDQIGPDLNEKSG